MSRSLLVVALLSPAYVRAEHRCYDHNEVVAGGLGVDPQGNVHRLVVEDGEWQWTRHDTAGTMVTMFSQAWQPTEDIGAHLPGRLLPLGPDLLLAYGFDSLEKGGLAELSASGIKRLAEEVSFTGGIAPNGDVYVVTAPSVTVLRRRVGEAAYETMAQVDLTGAWPLAIDFDGAGEVAVLAGDNLIRFDGTTVLTTELPIEAVSWASAPRGFDAELTFFVSDRLGMARLADSGTGFELRRFGLGSGLVLAVNGAEALLASDSLHLVRLTAGGLEVDNLAVLDGSSWWGNVTASSDMIALSGSSGTVLERSDTTWTAQQGYALTWESGREEHGCLPHVNHGETGCRATDGTLWPLLGCAVMWWVMKRPGRAALETKKGQPPAGDCPLEAADYLVS
jgi:hypothetical protein